MHSRELDLAVCCKPRSSTLQSQTNSKMSVFRAFVFGFEYPMTTSDLFLYCVAPSSPPTQSEEQLVQKICLAFTISTLYLLVQPWPEELEEFKRQASFGNANGFLNLAHKFFLLDYAKLLLSTHTRHTWLSHTRLSNTLVTHDCHAHTHQTYSSHKIVTHTHQTHSSRMIITHTLVQKHTHHTRLSPTHAHQTRSSHMIVTHALVKHTHLTRLSHTHTRHKYLSHRLGSWFACQSAAG